MAAHPLTRPASWSLTVGAPAAPLWRGSAALLWLGGAAMAMAWALAVTGEALGGQIPVAALLLVWPGVLAWCGLAWHIWRRWTAGAHALTLLWQGPVERDEATGTASGGFHVAQWRAPVRVKVVLSWQGWMLVKLSRVAGREAHPSVHAWLDARELQASHAAMLSTHNRSLHQLRTLLHLPEGMTTQDGGAGAVHGTPRDASRVAMASWVPSFFSGAVLHRLVSIIRVERATTPSASAHSRQDTAFPATSVMSDRLALPAASQSASQRRGGRG